ncbi:MAG: PfkB family carbohydrate kinase [Planctomycetota bacterium]
MSLLVTGSIGIDTVETPFGRVENVLGGSAIYFSLAASLFTPVRMVGVVGEDFDLTLLEPLRRKGVDVSGVEVRRGSRTFRWTGRYTGAMNEAQTVDVSLNVLAERGAALPPAFADSRYLFLANTHPALQREFAGRLPAADLIMADTMDLWINNEPAELRKTLAVVHGLVLNEGEARLLTGKTNLVTAGREILRLGPRFVMIKKGEHGALLVSGDDLFFMPPYPTEEVRDPTGAGDSFTGGVMGYLAAQAHCGAPALPAGAGATTAAATRPGGASRALPCTRTELRAAMARGTVTASFVLESFSIDALARVTPADVERRLGTLRSLVGFDPTIVPEPR